MSAFFVSKEHIDVLVSAAMEFRASVHWAIHRPDFDPEEIGKLLWRENLNSLQARYPNDFEKMGSDPEIEEYRFRQYCDLKPIAVIKAVHCYEYQACEHDGWEHSTAHQITRAIESAAISHLPGYDAAPWGVSKDSLPAVCNPNVVSLLSLARGR